MDSVTVDRQKITLGLDKIDAVMEKNPKLTVMRTT